MEQIFSNAAAGLIAGIVAPIIFEVWRYIQRCCAQPKEIELLRSIISHKRDIILHKRLDERKTKESGFSDLNDTHRAGLYNGMLTELDVCLTNWTPNLSPDRKREVYDSLDWFNSTTSRAKPTVLPGTFELAHTGIGKWRSEKMEKCEAERMFDRLESIQWLKLTLGTAD